MESFTEVVKSLIGSRIMPTPANELCNSTKVALDILKNTECVEVASPFWVNSIEVLENDTKHMLWLQMVEAARLSWMIEQVDKMT